VTAPDFITGQRKGNWTHLAGTYDGHSILLYVNGEKIGCDEVQSGDIHYKTSPLTIGGRSKAGSTHTVGTQGEYDEIRIWNVAKNAEEIKANMHKTLTEPFPSSLVAYYRMDGQDTTSSTVCAETTGWSGTIHGVVEWLDSAAPVEMLEKTTRCHGPVPDAPPLITSTEPPVATPTPIPQ